jgi:hypothetical protein
MLFIFYIKSIIKPPDQIELTSTELNQEFNLFLSTEDSSIHSDVVHFDFFKGEYFKYYPGLTPNMHFEMDGGNMEENNNKEGSSLNSTERNLLAISTDKNLDMGTLTYNDIYRERDFGTNTDPIELCRFSFNVTSCDIFDSFMHDLVKKGRFSAKMYWPGKYDSPELTLNAPTYIDYVAPINSLAATFETDPDVLKVSI